MMALREEAQTLFTVVQTVEFGMPALMAHWRAGFWPRLVICSELCDSEAVKSDVLC